MAAFVLIAFGLKPRLGKLRTALSVFTLLPLLLAAIVNSLQFFHLLWHDRISTSVPFPLSAFTGFLFAVILWLSFQPLPLFTEKRQNLLVALNFAFALGIFPLAQMLFFGATDYRRPADVAVVFGARTYHDGRLSDALADRVRTACDLYHAGLVSRLFMSGGPGDGPVHETEAMRDYALRRGVPPEAIILDRNGVNTAATLRNLAEIAERHRYNRILAVSHGYHLPRIKMTAERHHLRVYTVPVQSPQFLGKLPIFMAREAAGWWFYFFKVTGEAPSSTKELAHLLGHSTGG